MAEPCGCRSEGQVPQYPLIYCPTHAAAPALLAALEEIDQRAMAAGGGTKWGPVANIHDIASAAIAKAKGENDD